LLDMSTFIDLLLLHITGTWKQGAADVSQG